MSSISLLQKQSVPTHFLNQKLSFSDKLKGSFEKYNISIPIVSLFAVGVIFSLGLLLVGAQPVLTGYLFKILKAGALTYLLLLITHYIIAKLSMRKFGHNEIHFAITHKHYYWLKCTLVNSKIDPNKENKLGFTPLHIAIAEEDIKATKMLLQHEKVKKFIDKRIGGNELDLKQPNALGLAIHRENFQLIKLLVKNNADTSIKESDGHTLAEVAVRKVKMIFSKEIL